MRGKMMLCAAVLLAAVFVTPACALDYSIDPPSAGDFGTATSDNTVYVGVEDNANVDRSKNSALVPPGFGTPTSYLPGSGEPLTPNLAGSGGTVTATNPSTGGGVTILPPTSVIGDGAGGNTVCRTEKADDAQEVKKLRRELEELLRNPPIDEEQAKALAFQIAALRLNAVGPEEYETLRLRRLFKNRQMITELDQEFLRESVRKITYTGRTVTVLLKNNQSVKGGSDL